MTSSRTQSSPMLSRGTSGRAAWRCACQSERMSSFMASVLQRDDPIRQGRRKADQHESPHAVLPEWPLEPPVQHRLSSTKRGSDKKQPFGEPQDRKSTRLNSSHLVISYAVFCLKKKKTINTQIQHILD